MWNNQTANQPRRNNLDLLRLALAIVVVFSHSFQIAQGNYLGEPLVSVSRRDSVMTLGTTAVCGFFSLSGFVIAASWQRTPSWRRFLSNRIRRIYPGFIAVMLLQSFLVAPFVTIDPPQFYTLKQSAVLAAEMLFLLPYGAPFNDLLAVFPHNPEHGSLSLNPPLWTLRYEFWCYMLVLVIGLAGGLRRRLPTAGLLLVVWLVLVSDITLPWNRALTAVIGPALYWPRLLACFLSGVVFAVNRDRIPRSAVLAFLSAVVLVVCASSFRLGLEAAFPFAGTYLLMWTGFHPGIRSEGITRLGDLSYGTYLYGFPVQQLLVHGSGGALGPWTLFTLSLPVILVLAASSWHLVERHFQRKGPAV